MVPSVDRVGRYFPLTLVAELPQRRQSDRGRDRLLDLFRARGAFGDRNAGDGGHRFRALRSAGRRRSARRSKRSPCPPRVVLDPAAAAMLGKRRSVVADPDRLHGANSGRCSSSCWRSGCRRSTSRWCCGGPRGHRSLSRVAWSRKACRIRARSRRLLDGTWAQYRDGARCRRASRPARRWRRCVEDPATPVGLPIGRRERCGPVARGQRGRIRRTAGGRGVGRGRRARATGPAKSPVTWSAMRSRSWSRTRASRARSTPPGDACSRSTSTCSARAPPATPRRSKRQHRVVLLVRGMSWAISVRGDSRVYRWRSGRLERLTRDHSAAGQDGLRAGVISCARRSRRGPANPGARRAA